MSPESFFYLILSLQAVFVAAMILIVARRFPNRLRLYRLVAPAALPLVLFAMATFAYLRIETEGGLSIGSVQFEPVMRLFLADAVLWLVGVLFASLLIRLTRR